MKKLMETMQKQLEQLQQQQEENNKILVLINKKLDKMSGQIGAESQEEEKHGFQGESKEILKPVPQRPGPAIRCPESLLPGRMRKRATAESSFLPVSGPAPIEDFTWEQARKTFDSVAAIEHLSLNTIRNYSLVYRLLEEEKIQPRELADQQKCQRVIDWIASRPESQKLNSLKAIKKMVKVCYPAMHISWPMHIKEPKRKRIPLQPKKIIKIISKIAAKDKQLACSCLFMVTTGLRLGDSLSLDLKSFGKKGVLTNFAEKKGGVRDFVVLTKDFMKIAADIGWEKIPYSRTWFQQQLQKYGLWPHTLRACFVTLMGEEARIERVKGAAQHKSTSAAMRYVRRDLDSVRAEVEEKLSFGAIGFNYE